MWKVLYFKFRHLILYGVFGVLSASMDFLVFTFLSKFIEIPYIIANCFSVLAGISISFCLNRIYNFKVKDKVAQRFSIFLIVGLLGLCLSNLILWVGIERLGLQEMLAKLASIVIVVFFQFLINKTVTFKQSH